MLPIVRNTTKLWFFIDLWFNSDCNYGIYRHSDHNRRHDAEASPHPTEVKPPAKTEAGTSNVTVPGWWHLPQLLDTMGQLSSEIRAHFRSAFEHKHFLQHLNQKTWLRCHPERSVPTPDPVTSGDKGLMAKSWARAGRQWSCTWGTPGHLQSHNDWAQELLGCPETWTEAQWEIHFQSLVLIWINTLMWTHLDPKKPHHCLEDGKA